MTTARRQLVSVEATPYYHCVSRCVRRSFLCGKDIVTKKDYEHRRGWVERKILSLTKIFCIDVCAYAVMSNHYHLVLHLNKRSALSLSHEEIIEKWGLGHKIPLLLQLWQKGKISSPAEEKKCIQVIEKWRERLWSLSWFMKELNYDIACRANQEDNCTGHFWESRFKSQAILDEKALAAAMTYVDLNPVRAGVSQTPEQSEYTSFKARIKALNDNLNTAPCLYPFIGEQPNDHDEGIPFRLIDYLELVDWSARQLRDNKSALAISFPPILVRLNLGQKAWLNICTDLEKTHSTAVGAPFNVERLIKSLNKARICLYRLE